MDIYEFFIRLSMINGRKLSNLHKVKPILQDLDADVLLQQMQFSAKQIAEFWQVDQPTLSRSLAWLQQEDHHLLTIWHPEYPYLLKQISQPPLLLFCQGNLQLLDSPQIAMVGSRQFSPYGAHWTKQFATQLSQAGLTITSGLAIGIDAIAHRAALQVNGATIAVLGSGLKQITPKLNLNLAKTILAQQGLIISEFLPDTAAHPKHFPRRNRIISGLSLATLIIEASLKSGSLITARYALEQNRELFTIAGDIGCDNYAGNHWLIQQGANLVTSPQQILDHLNTMPHWLNLPLSINTEATAQDLSQLSAEQQAILSLIQHQPIAGDQLAEQSNLSVITVNQIVMDLELAGLIETEQGGYVRKRN